MEIILCGSCNKNPAPIHNQYGPLHCKSCNQKDKRSPLKRGKEYIPDYIKEDRKANLPDTIQSRRDGEPSKEFIETYPEQAKKTFTNEEMKKAKRVWTDLPSYSKHFNK